MRLLSTFAGMPMSASKKVELQVHCRGLLLRVAHSLGSAYGRRALHQKKTLNCTTPEPGSDSLPAEVGGRSSLPSDWITPEGRERFPRLPFQIQFVHLPREGEILMGTALMGEWDTVPPCW